MSELSLYTILGFPVHVPTQEVERLIDPFVGYLTWFKDRINRGVATHAVTINAEMVMMGRQDNDFAQVLHEADLLTPDGAGIVLALKLQGVKILRCPGIELAEQLLELAANEGWSLFLLGGKPEVSQRVIQRWRDLFPHLKLEGRNGYFDPEIEQQLCEQLVALQPQVVFVGLGSPRQEYWIRKHRHLLPSSTWIGIGGSLDIWAGVKDRAPQWFRDRHLEWLYRLYKEPWRWRRMLALPKFAWYVLVNGVRTK